MLIVESDNSRKERPGESPLHTGREDQSVTEAADMAPWRGWDMWSIMDVGFLYPTSLNDSRVKGTAAATATALGKKLFLSLFKMRLEKLLIIFFFALILVEWRLVTWLKKKMQKRLFTDTIACEVCLRYCWPQVLLLSQTLLDSNPLFLWLWHVFPNNMTTWN